MTYGDEELIPVRLRGAWGFIDRTGKLAIDPQYGSTEPFSEGLAAASYIDWAEVDPRSLVEASHGFLAPDGTWAISPRERWCSSFSNGRARIRVGAIAEPTGKDDNYQLTGGMYGFIDSTGNEVISAQYDKAADFREGRAVVSKDNTFGFIDCDGRDIVPLHYGFAWSFRNGFARVSIQGEPRNVTTYVGSDEGRSALSQMFFGSYKKKKVIRRRDWLQGYIDPSGREILSPRFIHATDFSEGVAVVSLPTNATHRSMLIDQTGAEITELPEGISFHASVSGGLIPASTAENGQLKYGWLNLRGEWAIEPRFTQTFSFVNGLGLFLDRNRYGYVDPAGQQVILPRFDSASPFRNGYASVIEKGKYGIITENGRYLWQEP